MITNYIENYLSVLPQYDKLMVDKIIKENMDRLSIKELTENEFIILLERMVEEQRQFFSNEETGDIVSEMYFNTMYENVTKDLKTLYENHMVAEKIISNYDRILKGILFEIEQEMNDVEKRIKELDIQAKEDDGLQIITIQFDQKEKEKYMELDKEAYRHLFQDRDGSGIDDIEVISIFHKHFITNQREKKENVLQNTNGQVTGRMERIEGQEVYKEVSEVRYAIDDSLDTYWLEEVITDQPIRTTLHKGEKK